MFKLFAELIGFHLDTREKLSASEATLLDERKTAELREQFIAVLGHDPRNPPASIEAGVAMLQKGGLDDRAIGIVGLMRNSVRRMGGLIDNVLDFARGRLGSGFTLQVERKPLAPTLVQVIEELRAAWPERRIETSLDLAETFACDHVRLAQVLSNLLGNALAHGTADAPIQVAVRTDADGLTLEVANAGAPIPPAAMERLFQPFYRGHVRPSLQGLGLGLYIAAQIARAHGGDLTVASSNAETRFTLRIPAAA